MNNQIKENDEDVDEEMGRSGKCAQKIMGYAYAVHAPFFRA